MQSHFRQGFLAMLPITIGIFPFGAVMGTVTAEAGLSLWQSTAMNLFVFAGASQLAAIDLLGKEAPLLVVLMTGLVINARFFLYSAAFAPWVVHEKLPTKIFSSFFLTDQSFAAMSSHEQKFRGSHEAIQFYLGACLCMFFAWHGSVILGFVFGNVAPTSLNLEFAIPLSFISLLVPTLKNKKYVLVSLLSAILGILFHTLPLKLGLLVSALLSLLFVFFFLRRKT